MGYSVRNARWRYTQWSKDGQDGEELYDEQNDPGEIHNLAKDPSQAGLIAEMRKLIEPQRARFAAPDAAWRTSKPQPGR
jgi:arylsulfatase A-like enzyme